MSIYPFVGVTQGDATFDNALKNLAIIFDKIAIFDLESFINTMYHHVHGERQLGAELQWLQEKGVVFHQELALDKLNKRAINDEQLLKYGIGLNFFQGQFFDKFPAAGASLEEVDNHLKNLWRFKNLQTRVLTYQLRELNEYDAVSLYQSDEFTDLFEVGNQKDVVHIVLKSMPTLDDNTPWESILDFRSDPESRAKFLALRSWMSDIAKCNLKPNEMAQKIEWLVHEYESHLDLHKMKFNKGVLETIVTVGAEFLEDVMKIKWGKAAKILFTLQHRKIQMLEAEAKAPGREVAYIAKARKKFQK